MKKTVIMTPRYFSLAARQRGAIGMMGAMILLLAVLFVALVIDTGRLMMIQRQLQTVADMAAIDAAAQTGYCGTHNAADVEALAAASAMRNNHLVATGETLDVDLGITEPDSQGVRIFSISDNSVATAVKVTANKSVNASLVAGGILGEQTTLSAVAVAQRQAGAGFSAGTTLVSLNTEKMGLLNNLFSSILGSSINLDLLSYQGLASTNIKLLDLVKVHTTASSVDEVLSSSLTIGELLTLYTDAFNEGDTANADVASALQTVTLAASSLSATLPVSDILAISAPDVTEQLDVEINLLDLITTSLLVANGTNGIDLTTPVTLPNDILNVVTELTVIEPPKIAIGPPGKDSDDQWQTALQTAQIRLQTKIKANINLVLAQVDASLAMNLEVAQGEAWLKSIQCRQQASPSAIVTIGAQPGIAAISLTDADDASQPASPLEVSLLGISIAEVPVSLNIPAQSANASDLMYEVSREAPLPQMQTASSTVSSSLQNGLSGIDSELQIGPVSVLSVSLVEQLLLGPLLNTVLSDLSNTLLTELLSPLLTQVSDSVIDPLLDILGIQLGSMDVTLISLDQERPNIEY